MRRYAVRFLVAVLTFGVGVGLSLVFGLFRAQNTSFITTWSARKSCSRITDAYRPPLTTVDSRGYEPLKLVYLGTAQNQFHGDEVRMKFHVENRSAKTISYFSISGNRFWGKSWENSTREIQFNSNVRFEPGESRTITIRRDSDTALSLRVDTVTFQDGSTWTNPREIE